MNRASNTQQVIDTLVRSTGATTPSEAVRLKARAVVAQFRSVFGEPTMPLDIEALASFLGIGRSEDAPAHSEDAELVPLENGRVAIRVNPDRPETRKRFSMAHEISHTFFTHYQSKVWCRTDARFRRRDNPDDFLEMLCDIGASELVMPLPWFEQDARMVGTGAELLELAKKYNTSREAILRRYAEMSDRTVQAVFFSWRLKPTENQRLKTANRQMLLGLAERERPAKKLRLDYSIPSPRAADNGYYIPPHKSVTNAVPINQAAVGTPCEGECFLDLGPAAGRYRIIAIPVWTHDDDIGPTGENSVGAIIERIEPKPQTRVKQRSVPTLFT